MNLFSIVGHFLFQKKILVIITILIVAGVGYSIFGGQKQTQQYQIGTVEKGTLVVSLSESGQVSSANNTGVNTQMGGVVKTVYVKNGDIVRQGDKIADLELDQSSQAKQQTALANYQQAQTNLSNAKAQLYTLQSQMFAANQTFINGKGTASPVTDDPNYVEQNADWLAAEAQYKNQQAVISQAQTSLSSAWLSYQQSSSTIVAPISGTVTGLSVQQGSVIAASSNSSSSSSSSTSSTSSNSSSSSTKIASIKTEGNPLVTLNLSEVDVPKVKVGQKATLTFDALPNKTFTGHVFSVDTTGSVSSGVTTYPAIIQLDDTNDGILPNMSATANIITATKDNVLLIPSAAVHTTNGTSTVSVLQNGQPTAVEVTIGDASDSQTEIVSGLSEGQTIITNIVSTQSSSSTTSPFSSTRGFGGGFGGGNAVRISR
jgi:macrolide-specific efflux system membrane fusion protein